MRAQGEKSAKEPEPGLRSASILKPDLVTSGAVSDKGVIQVALPGVFHRCDRLAGEPTLRHFLESWRAGKAEQPFRALNGLPLVNLDPDCLRM